MPRRYTLLFLLMVTVPLALLAWIGAMMVREDKERSQAAWNASMKQRLEAMNTVLTGEMARLGSEFNALLENLSLDEAAIMALPREQPLVRYAFLLDERSRLIFPKRKASEMSEAGAFLRRTEPLWESGVRFGTVAKPVVLEGANTYNSSSSGGTWSLMREGRIEVRGGGKSKGAANYLLSGWHVWFYGSGAQMLFWQERQDGRVVGVEVEMASLISQLINRLNNQPESYGEVGLWRFRETQSKRVLNEWGMPVSAGERSPAAVIPCAEPLNMWQLELYVPRESGPRNNVLAVMLGASGAGLGLLGLAWLLHRESTRETREARRRVSFVNQVSHELKTPLTNIRLYAEMAQHRAESVGDETITRHLRVVEAETSRLSRLIHNVLTFARQQRDQLTVRLKPGSLDEVVERVISLWRPGLEAKGFTVQLNLNAPDLVNLDADAVEQILGNLLSNVEKYAAAGRWVGVTTAQMDDATRLVVEDAGSGVPAGMKEAVFAPFVRLRNDLAEGASGTGIGLAISRQLAQLQGGTLVLEKTAHGGARFAFTLPAEPR